MARCRWLVQRSVSTASHAQTSNCATDLGATTTCCVPLTEESDRCGLLRFGWMLRSSRLGGVCVVEARVLAACVLVCLE